MSALLTVNSDVLSQNYKLIKTHYPHVKVLAYIKQNAYGIGDEIVSAALRDADGFGVTDLKSAYRLKSIYADKLIVDAALPPNLESLLKAKREHITVVVYSMEMLDLIESHQIKGQYWIKVNTGFNRLGIVPDDLDGAIRRLDKWTQNELVLMTHFMDSDVKCETFKQQYQLWDEIRNRYPNMPNSFANSALITQDIKEIGDWVRPGIMLYGLSQYGQWGDLSLALTITAPIHHIQTVNAGSYIGYDHSHQFKKNTRVAIIAMGYGDGFPVQLSPKARLFVNGHHVPIVGRISMDFIAVDIGDIHVSIGDQVEILGPNSKIQEGFPNVIHSLLSGFQSRRMKNKVVSYAE